VWYDQTVSTPPGAQPRDLGEILDDLAVRIERVRVLYEQYFMGIEKIEPGVARKSIARELLTLQQQYIRNTGLRFRFNTMNQKWNLYTTHWNRILREIEGGTYTRHIQRAARKAQSEGRELPRELLTPQQRANFDETQRIHDDDSWPGVPLVAKETDGTDPGFERIQPTPKPVPLPLFPPPPPASAARPTPPPAPRPPVPAPPPPVAAYPPRAPKPPPPPPAAIPGMNETELRTLHKKFVATRTMNGEQGGISYETLVNSLAKQVPRVLEQPGAKGVRFEVAVQNGRAILKAIPTKSRSK
jgi:hypothetical protein